MAKVIAKQKGYFGGEIREAGSSFVVPDDIMADKTRRPKWVTLAAFGGKGDHDGDGHTGGSVPTDGGDKPKGRGKGKGKPETVEAPTAEPFGDAPAPVTVQGNGVQEALGGPAPDWIAPDGSAPQPVTD